MRETFGFKKSVCTVVTTVFTVTQLLVYAPVANADHITDYAAEGRAFGSESATWFKNNLPELTGKKITIKKQNGGDLSIDNTDKMSGSTSSSSRYSVETTSDTMEKLQDVAGDTKTRADLAQEQQDSIMGMIQKITNGDPDAKVTIENTVYSLMKNMGSKKLPDYSSDAMFEITRSILENLGDHSSDLAACDSSSAKVTKDEIVHIPNEVVCQQVLDRSGECELTHNYKIDPPISLVEGPTANIKSCGQGCIHTWLGTVGNNYLPGGSCSLYTREIIYQVNNPQAIKKVELDYAAYDDQMEVYINPNGSNNLVYRGPLSTFPFESDGTRNSNVCELSTHWIWDPHGLHNSEPAFGCTEGSCRYIQTNLPAIDITKYFATLMKGSKVKFLLRIAVGGKGEAYAGLRVYYDTSKLVSEYDDWTPPACLDTVLSIGDGVAKGTYTCVDMPNVDSYGCTLEGLTPVCEENLAPAPLEGLSPLCKKVKVSGNFTFYKGDTGCWQAYMGSDENGNPLYEEVCGGENVGGNLDTCKEYEEAGCKFLGSECTPGMMGASGNCYVADLRYDCGTDEVVSKTTIETDYSCTGIRCLGDECAEIRDSKSTDFAKVNAMLNMIDQAGQDMQCTGVDEDGGIIGTGDITCQVFKGEKGQCKIAVGGWQNCCKENGSTPSLHTYIKTMRSIQSAKASSDAAQNLLSGAQTISASGAIEGAVGGAVDFAFSFLANYAGQFASFIDEKTGKTIQALTATPSFVYNAAFTGVETIGKWFNADLTWIRELFSPARVFVDQVKAKIKEYIQELLTKFVNKITGAVTGGGTGGGIGGTGQMAGQQAGATAAQTAVGTALMVVGYVYMAYMIAKMIVSIVYACEEEEMQTVSKIAVKSCHYLGSYCVDKILGVCIMKKRSYCCFSSPLGRILNEQVRAQTETITLSDGTTKQIPKVAGWGSAKEPNCEGVYVEDMDKIDWDAIDLSEWTNILETNNLSMEQEKALGMEPMTGKGESVK